MGIAVLLFILAIVAVHWWEYRRSVTEYTFAQPATLDKHDDLRSVLAEKTPMAVEIGALPWRPEVADKSTWTVVTDSGAEMAVGQWLSEKDEANGRPTLLNGRGLAEEMGLVTGLADLDESRAWWWLPGMHDATVGILKEGEVSGLEWVRAERKWVGCSHGAPLTLWLVHNRYRRYLPDVQGENPDIIDPWALTVAEAPWIGRVQFVEVTVKPGWCIGLPAHWGFAVRSSGPESWWWSASQNSPLSWSLCNTGRILQHIGPSMSEEED
jgi:hypothetical protein